MSDDTTYAPTLPAAVREQVERANALAREAGILNVPPLEGLEEPSAEDVTTVVETPELELPLEGGESPAQPPPPAQPDWEQRYNTLQGKYNSEIPELRGQLRAMQDLIANMQAPRTREETFAPTPQPTLPQRQVPAEDFEAYGQDLPIAVQRWSMLAAEPRLSVLEQRLVQLEQGNQQLATMSATQRVDAALDRALPEWRTLNNDPGFIAWINERDPFTGQIRKRLADEAYGAGDSARTLAFFTAYQREHTTVGQSPGTQPIQTGQAADRLPLANLAVPGRGPTAAPPTPGAPQRRIWSNADIQTFYRQRQQGRWLGREAQADALERDIFAAGAEGRVR